MLFYLQSRGIDKDEATSMLIRGFAQEIIDEFEDENIINALEEILKNKINILDIVSEIRSLLLWLAENRELSSFKWNDFFKIKLYKMNESD